MGVISRFSRNNLIVLLGFMKMIIGNMFWVRDRREVIGGLGIKVR